MNGSNINFLVSTLSNSDSSDATTTLSETVNDVTNLAGTISEHGILVVIAAAFLVFTILIFLLFLHLNNTMLKAVIKQFTDNNNRNDAITDKLVDFVTSDDDDNNKGNEEIVTKLKEQKKQQQEEDANKTPKHGKDLVKLYINRETVFKSAAKIVFESLKCSRIGIYVFHNGNETPYGLPFIKMSCIFDQGVNGIKTQRGLSHINMPLHFFDDMVESLYNSNEYYCNIEDTDENSSIRSFAASSNSKSGYCVAIASEGTILGFISCEFSHNIDFNDAEELDKIRSVMHDMTISIKYIIINRANPDQFVDLKSGD